MGAKGKRARLSVFNGTFSKTYTGLKKSDLMKNKAGKIVSKKSNAAGKKAYLRIKGWTAAVTKARKALGVKGFLAVRRGPPCTRRPRSSTASEHLKPPFAVGAAAPGRGALPRPVRATTSPLSFGPIIMYALDDCEK